MSFPEELKVRESLFSGASSDHVNGSGWRCSGGGGGGGGDHTSEYPRRSPREEDPTPSGDKRVVTCKTTTTSAAYIPASSLSYGTATGWKGGRGRPWRSLFARKPRALRRAIVAAPWTSPIAAHHLAAVQIQRHTRGFIAKAKRSHPDNHFKDRSMEKRWSRASGRSERTRRRSRTGGGSRQLDKYLRCVADNEAAARDGGGSGGGRGGGGDGGGGYSEWCCCRIQAWWRMIVIKWNFRYLRFPFYGLATLQIQYAWRNYRQNAIYDMSTNKEIASAGRFSSLQEGSSLLPKGIEEPGRDGRQGEEEEEEEEEEDASVVSPETLAAKAIQTCWRNRVSRSIYRYYRNVIDFRLGGDPRLLLRAINPGEAALFDRAAGVHVRFRLGGYTFPPSIYYKVYTHQPVADIGAFAPRAYSEDAKETPADRWNHPPRTGYPENPEAGQIRVGASYFGTAVKRTGPKGTENWYRRHENNGWRPITIKTLTSAEDDPVTIATAKAPAARSDRGGGGDHGGFHYSKLVREECRAARIKRRKRRWLMSMYSAGLAEAAAASSGLGAGAATSAARSFSPPRTPSHSQHQPQRDDSQNHQGHGDGGGSGGGGGGAPGWEQGGYRGAERDSGLPQQGSEDGQGDDGALLVRWSEGLDFDRYLSEWRQTATSGPSEPWKNADGFADYVAAKGGGITAGGGRATGSPAPAAATKVSGTGNNVLCRGEASMAAPLAAVQPFTPPTGSPFFPSVRGGGGGGGGGDRRRGGPSMGVGERKGGALYDDGYGIIGDRGDDVRPMNGGGGGNGEEEGCMFDSIGVDLGSASME